ncbi:hypothetical protein B0T16DRAFT_171800 [Cercophora newfieldiana]|uniref:Peptidase metallopeptidase domain-containing protein n=1 Tax=Cercophora newfieldiana TaxID=92897 RepID=A0AA39Y6L6_9PEZI|nr:hypothetical protein B0T16DRAFT_171800 [Cercophora newfieldiana]
MDPLFPKMCTQMPVPEGIRELAETAAIEENHLNGHQRNLREAGGAFGLGDASLQLSLPNSTLWENGRVLRVKIINGTPHIKKKIQQYANAWTDYANLSFVFVSDNDAEIRVRVDNSGQSWSRVGTDCLATPLSLPTMNLGWLNETTSDEEFSRVVMHEFGHAIGCIHEHQSPAGGIPWDKPAVYEYYARPPNSWPPAQVDINIFDVYSRTTTQFSDFDPSSIMLYPIAASLTIGHKYSTPWNTHLSETDKAFISETYPHQKPDTGRFSTDELKHKPAMSATQRQVFSRVYPSEPDIVVGLSALDLVPNPQMTVGVNCFADKITPSTADMHIQTTSNALLTFGAATWFKAAPGIDTTFQVGSVDSDPTSGIVPVTFDRPYDQPPMVVVWLSGFELTNPNNNNSGRWRVSVTASDVTPQGLALRFDTAAGTATASWIAFPRGSLGVAAGSFSTQDSTVNTNNNSSWSGKAPILAPNVFRGRPPSQVLVALNSLNVAVGDALSVKVDAAVSPTEAAVGWTIEGGGNGGVLYSAGASFVALA